MVIPYFTHAYNFVQTLGVPQCACHLRKVNLHGKWVRSSNSHKARAYLDLHFLFSEALHSPSSPPHTHTCIRSRSDSSPLCGLVKDLKVVRTGKEGSPRVC